MSVGSCRILCARAFILWLQNTHKIIQLLELHNRNNLHFYLEGCWKQLCKNSAVKVLSSFPCFSLSKTQLFQNFAEAIRREVPLTGCESEQWSCELKSASLGITAGTEWARGRKSQASLSPKELPVLWSCTSKQRLLSPSTEQGDLLRWFNTIVQAPTIPPDPDTSRYLHFCLHISSLAIMERTSASGRQWITEFWFIMATGKYGNFESFLDMILMTASLLSALKDDVRI